ncbi:MAG: hypothetical protein R6W70_01030 [bacterium]
MNKKYFFACYVLLMIFVSCGGQEQYKTPYVERGGITQSECKTPDEWKKEEFSLSVREKEITLLHKNILLPRNSVVGIEDNKGYISWQKNIGGETSLLYLEGDEKHISVRERIDMSSEETLCYYDVAVIIKNISAGEYDFLLFDEKDYLIFESEVVVR